MHVYWDINDCQPIHFQFNNLMFKSKQNLKKYIFKSKYL